MEKVDITLPKKRDYTVKDVLLDTTIHTDMPKEEDTSISIPNNGTIDHVLSVDIIEGSVILSDSIPDEDGKVHRFIMPKKVVREIFTAL